MANLTYEEYIKKIHHEILSIMDDVKCICDSNNIKYYIVGGTLLGAVRHKGFIPWDDDFDIAMPRKDFNKFISICDQKLEKNHKLLWQTTDKNYWLNHAKIENITTVFQEKKLNLTKTQWGIYIDIFPLDNVSNNPTNYRFIKYLNTILLNIKRNYTFKKAIKPTFKHKLRKLISNFIPIKVLFKIQTFLLSHKRFSTNNYLANFGSQYPIEKQIFHESVYGEGLRLQFCNKFFNAPNKYELVLKTIYGNNFMDLPPKSKRMTHLPLRVVFSDGKIFEHDEKQTI